MQIPTNDYSSDSTISKKCSANCTILSFSGCIVIHVS